MNIHGWKFVKKKSGFFKKRPSEKKIKKNGLEQKKEMKRKKERKKRSRSAI